MFTTTEEYAQIISELEGYDILNNYALFEVYGDSIATYTYEDKSICHCFEFICNDWIGREIMIEDMFKLQKITYFKYTVLLRKRPCDEIAYSIEWSMYDVSGMN